MLTGYEIARQVTLGNITISPFNPEQVNPNSYDVTLGNKFIVFGSGSGWEPKEVDLNKVVDGFVLLSGRFYLASTIETVGSDLFVPMLSGKSTLARRSLMIHQTGAFIDLGFRGEITCELTCTMPVRIHAGMRIGQLSFESVEGKRTILYGRDCGKYQGQQGPTLAREEVR